MDASPDPGAITTTGQNGDPFETGEWLSDNHDPKLDIVATVPPVICDPLGNAPPLAARISLPRGVVAEDHDGIGEVSCGGREIRVRDCIGGGI